VQSLLEIKLKRLVSILLITLFDLIQVLLILKLDVETSGGDVKGYSFSIRDNFALNNLTIFYLVFAPILFTYFGIINNAKRPDLVQIIGPNSLHNAVDRAFSDGSYSHVEKSDDTLNLYFNDLAKGEPLGTVENLSLLYAVGTLVKQLIDESGVKSIKKVFISDRDIPNAFTLRVIPLPYIGEDWIIINRNLVEILKPEEVKAVLAHEVGHAARYDSWLNTFISVPKWIIIFGWSIVFFKMMLIIFNDGLAGFTIYRLFALFLFFVIIRISLNVVQSLSDMFRRNSELLADHYGAELVGSEILVNGLIKIARRAEVVNSVQKDLEWLVKQTDQVHPNMYLMSILNDIPRFELSTEKVRKDVIENYVSFKLRDTFKGLRIPISEDDLKILIDESCKNINSLLLEKVTTEVKDKPFSILNWKDVDLDKNEYLSNSEISLLADKLKETERVKIDPKTLANMGLVLESPSHPHINSRIIFINDSLIVKELDIK
jgi:Zn-dependent protease with chaperone function